MSPPVSIPLTTAEGCGTQTKDPPTQNVTGNMPVTAVGHQTQPLGPMDMRTLEREAAGQILTLDESIVANLIKKGDLPAHALMYIKANEAALHRTALAGFRYPEEQREFSTKHREILYHCHKPVTLNGFSSNSFRFKCKICKNSSGPTATLEALKAIFGIGKASKILAKRPKSEASDDLETDSDTAEENLARKTPERHHDSTEDGEVTIDALEDRIKRLEEHVASLLDERKALLEQNEVNIQHTKELVMLNFELQRDNRLLKDSTRTLKLEIQELKNCLKQAPKPILQMDPPQQSSPVAIQEPPREPPSPLRPTFAEVAMKLSTKKVVKVQSQRELERFFAGLPPQEPRRITSIYFTGLQAQRVSSVRQVLKDSLGISLRNILNIDFIGRNITEVQLYEDYVATFKNLLAKVPAVKFVDLDPLDPGLLLKEVAADKVVLAAQKYAHRLQKRLKTAVVLGHQKYLNRELRKANDVLEMHSHGNPDDTMMEISSNAVTEQGTNDRIAGDAITAAPDNQ